MMKKQLLLSLLVIVSTSNLFSQMTILNNQKHKQEYKKKATKNYTSNNNRKAIDSGGWFNYGGELLELLGDGDIKGYYGMLHTDSSMVRGYINDAGDSIYSSVFNHSSGQVLDPTSLNFGNTGFANYFLPGAGFILDTIRFPYRYIRTQDAVPDKLIIQIYTSSAGLKNDASVGGVTFWYPEYDYINQIGKNAVQTIEYDLTNDDATVPGEGGMYQVFALDPPIEMPTGGLVAATYTFHPKNTFNQGDTLASSSDFLDVAQNPRNSFWDYSYDDEAQTVDQGYENYGYTIGSTIQYNVDTMGWNGNYVPGIAWQNSTNHQDIDFHLTPIAPTNTSNISLTNIKLYPNPANNKVNIVFNNSNDVNSIRITDVTGRTVYTETITNSTITVNTSHYTPGIYFCEIKGTKTNETIKFTKIK